MTDDTVTSQIETAVQSVLEGYRDAWNAADAEAFGSLFTENATYVIFLGNALTGRRSIVENHREVFTKWQAGTSLVIQALSTHQLSDTVISVLTVGGVDTNPDAMTLDKFQTLTLVRQNEGWKIAAFHNTSMSQWNISRYNTAD